jgi:hypothetical protein
MLVWAGHGMMLRKRLDFAAGDATTKNKHLAVTHTVAV